LVGQEQSGANFGPKVQKSRSPTKQQLDLIFPYPHKCVKTLPRIFWYRGQLLLGLPWYSSDLDQTFTRFALAQWSSFSEELKIRVRILPRCTYAGFLGKKHSNVVVGFVYRF
jgi:hypothetical protein